MNHRRMTSGALTRAGALLGLLLSGLAVALAGRAEDPALLTIPRLQASIDECIEAGLESPGPALSGLEMLLRETPAGTGRNRMLLLGRGIVAASSGNSPAIDASLHGLGQLHDDPLAAADADLVRSVLSDNLGQSEPGVRSATAALEIYRRYCPAQPGCDYRSSWRALQMLSRHERRRGQIISALEDARGALDIARVAHDRPRQAIALAMVSNLEAEGSEPAVSQQHLAEAVQIGRELGDPALMSRLESFVQADAERRGDLPAALSAGREGLALARQAHASRQIAVQLSNNADVDVKTGHPEQALREAMEALPTARRFGDRRLELNSLHNLGLAQVALGNTAAALQTLEDVAAAYRVSSATAKEAELLREFGDALASAGDYRRALELFHRERKLTADILAANRDAALAQLRAHYDREAQQRQLTQLQQDNSLMAAQISNREDSQRVWLGVGLVLVLAMVLVAILYRRVRDINRKLAERQNVLREQSLRDPLTGLANRRQLHDRCAATDRLEAFSGILLLVDIDHFKRINDQYGHAAGDHVLIELARRLTQVVRDDDMILRWGGEEFLIHLRHGETRQAQELADRVLQVIGSQMIALPAGELRVTTSVGYAAFPLAPERFSISLERAINLADMALYTAKHEGRNCAIGIESVDAADSSELLLIEADFDLALHDGRVTLRRTSGPQTPLMVVGASAA